MLSKLLALTIYDSGHIIKMCLRVHGYSDVVLLDLSEMQKFQYNKGKTFFLVQIKKDIYEMPFLEKKSSS